MQIIHGFVERYSTYFVYVVYVVYQILYELLKYKNGGE